MPRARLLASWSNDVAEPFAVNKPKNASAIPQKKSQPRARPLAELLGKTLNDAFARQGFASTELVTRWAEIVGTEIAAHSQPEKIQWPRGDGRPRAEPGTLVLRVEGPTAIEIQHLSGVILERVNRFFGWQAVGSCGCGRRRCAGTTASSCGRPTPKRPRASRRACRRSPTTTCAMRWRGSAPPSNGRELGPSPERRHCHICGFRVATSGSRANGRALAVREAGTGSKWSRALKITRREFTIGAGATALATAMAGMSALMHPALAQSPSPAELMQPGPLGDMVLGDEKAPVTIIEYASMTCPHCAHFHETTYPELKKRYIDTGKVRFIFREFPLDPLAMAGLHAGALRRQGQIFPDDRDAVPAAEGLGGAEAAASRCWRSPSRPASPSRPSTNAWRISKLLDGHRDRAPAALQKFNVNSTPTFFINGKSPRGAFDRTRLEKQIEPYLKG